MTIHTRIHTFFQWDVVFIRYHTLVAALTKFDTVFLSCWQPAGPPPRSSFRRDPRLLGAPVGQCIPPSFDPSRLVRLAQLMRTHHNAT